MPGDADFRRLSVAASHGGSDPGKECLDCQFPSPDGPRKIVRKRCESNCIDALPLAAGILSPVQPFPLDVAQQQPTVGFYIVGTEDGARRQLRTGQKSFVDRSQDRLTLRARFHSEQGQCYKFLIAAEYQPEAADDGIGFMLQLLPLLATATGGVGLRWFVGPSMDAPQQQITFTLNKLGQCIDVDKIAFDFKW